MHVPSVVACVYALFALRCWDECDISVNVSREKTLSAKVVVCFCGLDSCAMSTSLSLCVSCYCRLKFYPFFDRICFLGCILGFCSSLPRDRNSRHRRTETDGIPCIALWWRSGVLLVSSQWIIGNFDRRLTLFLVSFSSGSCSKGRFFFLLPVRC